MAKYAYKCLGLCSGESLSSKKKFNQLDKSSLCYFTMANIVTTKICKLLLKCGEELGPCLLPAQMLDQVKVNPSIFLPTLHPRVWYNAHQAPTPLEVGAMKVGSLRITIPAPFPLTLLQDIICTWIRGVASSSSSSGLPLHLISTFGSSLLDLETLYTLLHEHMLAHLSKLSVFYIFTYSFSTLRIVKPILGFKLRIYLIESEIEYILFSFFRLMLQDSTMPNIKALFSSSKVNLVGKNSKFKWETWTLMGNGKSAWLLPQSSSHGPLWHHGWVESTSMFSPCQG